MEDYIGACSCEKEPSKKDKMQRGKQKMTRSIASSITSKDKETKEKSSNNVEKTKTTKIERKAYYDEYK